MEEEIEEIEDFAIPMFEPSSPDPGLFLPGGQPYGLALGCVAAPLSAQEKQWVSTATQSAKADPDQIHAIKATAPTAPALRALEKQLALYGGALPATREAWQNYIMTRYFELSTDIDPKIAKPALDALAKTNIVGLHEEKVEISLTTRSVVELEGELAQRINRLLSGVAAGGASVAAGGASDQWEEGEWREI